MIQVRNIKPKARRRNGVTYESTFDHGNEYHADLEPGKSIRIFGVYRNHVNGPQVFNQTFRVGDEAEYGSYNLHYTGAILAIGKSTVLIDANGTGERRVRLDLHTFCWRNWDFDSIKIANYNAAESMCI